jgi:hypothetical protein
MAAAAAAAITAGHMIKFRKHPVDIFFIIMNSFNQFSPQARKRIFFFPGNELIQGKQAVITYATIKGFGQENAGFVADRNLRTIAGVDIFPVTGECFLTPRTKLLLTVH